MIKMVVLDMAGTTIDENMIVYKTLQRAIREAGYAVMMEQVLAEGAGREKKDAIRSILRVYEKTEEEHLVNRVYDRFVVLLEEAYDNQEILPQPRATALFQALRDMQIIVVLNTGYNEKTTRLLIRKLGWEQGREYDGLVTASAVQRSRPHPDMILLAMKQFGITDAKEVVKIGDSVVDIEEGLNACCGMSIGITTGAHTREQLEAAKPDHVIDDLMDLVPLLDGK